MVARCVLWANEQKYKRISYYTHWGGNVTQPNGTYVFHFNAWTRARARDWVLCAIASYHWCLQCCIEKHTASTLWHRWCSKYANAFRIDVCVRIIIFNGCRVSRLTVLFVFASFVSAGKNFIVTIHTCALLDTNTHTFTSSRWNGNIATPTHAYRIFTMSDESTLCFCTFITFDFYTHCTYFRKQNSEFSQIRKKTTQFTVCTSYVIW